ncbi:MAG TPA: lamin tail domain-containing protein, partial [Sedimentisphaerales bacterium]|nr:lamin tail domain-containing protein [Sedimentisphaerales bacterium]
MGDNRLRWLIAGLTACFAWANNADAFPMRVDIGNTGQPIKAGWLEFTGNGNNETDPKVEVYDVNGVSVTVSIRTGVLNDSGYRWYGGGDLGGDMVYPDNSNGPVNGRVILTLGGLPAGPYELTSYHNDTKADHDQQDPIDVTVSGAVSAPTSDLGVVQTKSMVDSGLGQSLVTFIATGTGDVVVTYTPTTDDGLVSKAVLNGFELHESGATQVQFDLSASSGPETYTPVLLAVSVYNPPGDQTVTVNYSATGGTATGGGEDYTLAAGMLTFDPGQTTPEYISITIENDGQPEPDETIQVTLAGPVNAELGVNSQHVYTILDTSPRVAFDVPAGEGRENFSPVNIPVSLSRAWNEPVTVDYNVTGGTAISGEDFVLPAGALHFDPCELTKYISLTIVEDDYDEDPDETIEITLSNPTEAILGANSDYVFTILPPVTSICPQGDVDGDCDTDMNDLKILAGQWLDPPGSCSGLGCADLDGISGINMSDYAFIAGTWLENAWPVVINEFMASNDTTLEDPDDAGDFPDWIELYNGGPLAIDLGGMYLTDNLDSPTKWEIPGGVTIGPGEYLIFYADDEESQGDTHTSYKLSADGEEIGLFDTDGTTRIDSIVFGPQVTDVSYGRYPDGSDNWRFLATGTPGAENVGAYLGEVKDTQFSHDRGFYDTPFNLCITCDTGGAEIHYTLNGSEPNEFLGDGTYLYTSPVSISQTSTVRAAAFKPGYLPSNVDAQTYIFLDDVLTQPSMNPTVIGTYGAGVVKDALQSVPTLSIVMDADDLANLQAQDSEHPETYPKVELSTSVELIYSDANDGEGFQINCGIEGHSWALNKRSYKLIFKSIFGPSQLRYPIFESAPHNADSAVDEFDRIVLRASKNMPITYAGDQWTRDSEIAMSGSSAHGTYVHLYINGTYWGLYNATERPDAWFTSSYFGGEMEDYFATNHGYERNEGHISGDSTRFDTMISMALARNLGVSTNYDTFKGLCDVQKFADYTILFWFSGFGDNIDNNWYAGMRNVPLIGEVPPEGFMMFMWDAEAVFQVDFVGPDCHEEPWVPPYYYTMTKYTIVRTWLALHDNMDFRMLFADRVYKHCFNNGPLVDDNTQSRWDAIVDHIDEAAICELARWPNGGGYPAGPGEDANIAPPDHIDMSGFVNTFMTALDAKGELYPTIDPPIFNQQGGHVSAGFSVTMTNPNGSGDIYYTLDGSDPRQPVTGNPVGTLYTGAVTLNLSRHVKARVLSSGQWSALNEATFAVGPVADNLRITEIMYNPADTNDPDDPNKEFIELKNIGPGTINVNLVRFTNGIDFTFGSLSLSSGQYVVVVKDILAFVSRYPGFGGIIAGQYSGSLNNGGERIELEDALGQNILDFTYKDGWRAITDGDGYSLTIINADAADTNDWGEEDSWRPSAYVGGSPGSDDSGIVPNPGAVVISEVMSHSHGGDPDWIELYNTTGGAIDLSGWFLSDSDSNVMKYEIAAGATIGAGQYLVFYEDVNFGDTNDPGCILPFALSENGEKVCLSSYLDGNNNLTGYRQVEDFGASESDVSFGRYYKASTD